MINKIHAVSVEPGAAERSRLDLRKGTERCRLRAVNGGPGSARVQPNCRPIFTFCKRTFDIIFSLFGLAVAGIPMIIIAILIKRDSEGPVFFKQKRIGRYQQPFLCLKFRSMSVTAPEDCPPYMFQNPDEYITKVGRRLRTSSLDELPQLINILRGEMSFVGPRPCTPKEVELIEKREQSNVYSMRPGLTGWAQVNGRDEISLNGKVRRDREYIRNANLLFDLRILWMTVKKVLKREGVHEGINEKNQQKKDKK